MVCTGRVRFSNVFFLHPTRPHCSSSRHPGQPKTPAGDALLLELERMPGLGIRRSIKPLALPPETLGYLAPKPRTAYFFEPARETLSEATA